MGKRNEDNEDRLVNHIISKAERRRQKRRSKQKSTHCPAACKTCNSTNPVDDIKELVVIGAGPHTLALMLRLLEQNADLLSEKERHFQAEHVQKMRPRSQVWHHVKSLLRGSPSPIGEKVNTSPPLSCEYLSKSVMVIDGFGSWLGNWKNNFEALDIPQLRSPISAHADPFDHRALEVFAELQGREDELKNLGYIPRGRPGTTEYRGPYEAPSTKLFHDFHDLLIRAYRLDDIVQKGVVTSIVPKKVGEESIFEIAVETEATACQKSMVRTRRVVCALGPMLQTGEAFWETSLRRSHGLAPFEQLLHAHEIVPWLLKQNKDQKDDSFGSRDISLLIVGGGITSAQLALLASDKTKSPWCKSVTLIQRSSIIERQFDIESKWMGVGRGRLLEDFWSKDLEQRSKSLKEARKGGSIPPEVTRMLHSGKKNRLQLKEEVQISSVQWIDGQFHVALDDGGAPQPYGMIWLATGAENDLGLYPLLTQLRNELPLQVFQGLPVLHSDLSWRSGDQLEPTGEEPPWKTSLRKRLWVTGCLAGLELGPDALNLLGARHGAVRVAKAIRSDMQLSKESNPS